ncbi:MAG: CHAT domain-containing protein [Saprospiraceae bacterium]|nr:CHAT domain-containing protein [Saprospiraceae bacterium]
MRIIFILFLFLMGIIPSSQAQERRQLQEYQVDSILQEVYTLWDKSQRAEAEDKLNLLLNLTDNPKGSPSAIYGMVCFEQGQFLSKYGEYKRADQAYSKARQVLKSIAPLDTFFYIDCLNYQAILRQGMGNYEGADSSLKEIITLRQELYPIQHPKLTSVFTELGVLYRKMGRFEWADSIYNQYIQQASHLDMRSNIEYPRLLTELGDLYREMEDFEHAEPTYIQARSYYTSKAQKKSLHYITLLTGLADMYLEMGQLDSSAVYLEEAKKLVKTGFIFKKVQGGPVLVSLAALYRANKQYEAAEELYLDGLDKLESDAQQTWPEYAQLHMLLANLYHEWGSDTYAEENYLKSLTLWQEIPGPHVPEYPQTMMGLGALYFKQRKYEEAKAYFLQSKEYWEETLGKKYPLYIINILDLARVAWVTGHFAQADSLYAEASALGRDRLTSAAHYMTARELHKYMQKILDTQAEIISFVSQSPDHDLAAEACYDNALFYKGFLLNAAVQVNRLAMSNTGSADIYQRLNAYRRLLSREYANPFSKPEDITLYKEKIEHLEEELICTLPDFASLLKPVHWRDISNALQADEAAIEIIRYQQYNGGFTDSTMMYAALVLLPGINQPEVISLFKEEALSFVLKPIGKLNMSYVEALYINPSRGLSIDDPTQLTLYELIWEKIQAFGLPGVKRVYFAPSGVLHRINMDAISITDEELLMDQYEVVTLSSTRELLKEESKEINRDSTAAIFGGIHFDILLPATDTTGLENNKVFAGSTLDLGEDVLANRSILADHWNFLIGSKKEAQTLEDYCAQQGIRKEVYTGMDGTEEAFKKLGDIGNPPSPWLLHLGTHGFFFPDPEPEESDHLLERRVIFKTSDQPMLRSGLILAGANYFWKENKIPPGMKEDGVLTAEEISHLDLSATELAVLAACETGLGDIEGNEGVYGLQRAFKIAGTRYLIMSLWTIPDTESKIFMEDFYQNWLVNKLSVRNAFHQTQRQMRVSYSTKYSWAGFVLLE